MITAGLAANDGCQNNSYRYGIIDWFVLPKKKIRRGVIICHHEFRHWLWKDIFERIALMDWEAGNL